MVLMEDFTRSEYGLLGLVAIWLISTYALYIGYDGTRILDAHVDIANTNAYTWSSRTIYSDGALELLLQGSEYLRSGVEYSVFVHITFLDSWTTVTSGLLTFLSDFGQGVYTVSSILPCTTSTFVWVMRRIVLCPLYITGLFEDTIEQDVLISTSFRYVSDNSRNLVDVPIYPVYTNHIDYTVRVQVVPPARGHLPDIVSISAWYRIHSASWYSVCLWYTQLILYLCLSATTLGVLLLYTTCSTVRYTRGVLKRSQWLDDPRHVLSPQDEHNEYMS